MTVIARHQTAAVLLTLAMLCTAGPAAAGQQLRQANPTVVRQVETATTPRSGLPSQEAEKVRDELSQVLARYSPTVGRVLGLDPSLLTRQGYLDPYPELVAFLGEHPEVTRDPAYYFPRRDNDYYRFASRESESLRMWGGFFAGFALFLIFCVVTGALVWLIKTLVDYRRWYRLSKVQTEAHNKLLDWFGANEDLLAYMGTPAGKRFLESAPILLDPAGASAGGPWRRILWAVEIGLVVVCGGVGLLFARQFVPEEMAQALSVVAIFAIAIGIGFILAAAASYLISWRMGLLASAASRNGRDADVHSAS